MTEKIYESAEMEEMNVDVQPTEPVEAEAMPEDNIFEESTSPDVTDTPNEESTVDAVDVVSEPDEPVPAVEESISTEEPPAAPAEKKPRATRRRKAAVSEPVAAPAPAESTAPRRKAPSRVIKSITGHLEATTAEKESNDAWVDITASMRSRRILKGTVFGVERWNKMPCAIVMYRGVKVIIPAKEFFAELPEGDDFEERSDTFLAKTNSYMENRLGSEIEFMVLGFVEKSESLVAGSRKRVMQIKCREYFMRKKNRTSDEFLMNVGQRVEVRVASALRFGLVVEVGGIDVFVPSKEVTWNRERDVSKDYYAGQKLVAVITELDRSNPDNIKVSVSIKQATPDPFDKASKILSTDRTSKYIGQVTMVAPHGVYVQLDNQLEVRCNHPRNNTYITVGTRVAVRVYEINEERREIRGEILWNGGLHQLT